MSVLSRYINILEQCPINYMHAALEGVIKKMMKNYWFSTSKRGKDYFLNDCKEQINIRLKSIRPPHNFRSSSRSIKDLLHWKAADFHSFLWKVRKK